MVFGAAGKRRFEKEEETGDAARGLLQLCDYFFFPKNRPNHHHHHHHHHHIEDNPATTTTNQNNPRTLSETSISSAEEYRIAKARQSLHDMHGESKRRTTTRGGRKKKKSMKPEISAAKHLLQLCVENSFTKDLVVTPKFKEEEENYYLKSRHMGLIDKSKADDDEHIDHHDDEESKSDVSYITDDCSDMETTLAEITAAQQIMQLSNSYQQHATTTAEEEEGEESTGGYNKTDLSAASSSSVVVSESKDFEEEEEEELDNTFLPRRKTKFRSLADLYENTHPLEDGSHFD